MPDIDTTRSLRQIINMLKWLARKEIYRNLNKSGVEMSNSEIEERIKRIMRDGI